MKVREIIDAWHAGADYLRGEPRPYATKEALTVDEAVAPIEAGARATALRYAMAAGAPGASDGAKVLAEIAAIHVRNAEAAEALVRACDYEAAIAHTQVWLTETISMAMKAFAGQASDDEAAAAWIASWRERLLTDYEKRLSASSDLLSAKARLAAWIEASEELAKIDKPMCAAVTVESSAAH